MVGHSSVVAETTFYVMMSRRSMTLEGTRGNTHLHRGGRLEGHFDGDAAKAAKIY